ncbi:MAG: hypothetical protein IT348_11165 [Candidatus Eisenbacteria bacterium]|nr:hypothetical protein [Candidatus Eisenbacteria bacterium]
MSVANRCPATPATDQMSGLAEVRRSFAIGLRGALAEALSSAESPAPLVLVTAPGGVGKTRMTAHLLRNHSVVWHAERNEMMDQLREFLGAPVPDVGPLVTPHAPQNATMVVPTVEKRLARADPGACTQYDARVAPLREQNLGRFEKALACRTCPDRPRCRYLQWRPATQWLFAPHVWLALKVEKPDLYAGRDIVVIDESPTSVMLQSITLSPAEVDAIVSALAPLPTQSTATTVAALLQFFGACQTLLSPPPLSRRRIALRSLMRDLGLELLNVIPSADDVIAGNAAVLQPVLEPGKTRLDPRAIRMTLQMLPKSVPSTLRGKVHQLFDALAEDTAERPTCVLVLPSERGAGGIVAGRYIAPPIPPQIPVVLLDATGFPAVYSRLFGGRRVICVTADPEQRTRVVQAVDHRYPASTLATPGGAASKRLMRVVARYKKENPSDRVGLIIKKGLMELHHVRQEVLEQFALADIGHYWAERGQNRFADYDALFVIGAPEINQLEMEARTRAFMSLVPPMPGEEPFNYEIVPARGDDSHHAVVTQDGEEFRQPDRGYAHGLRHLIFYELHGGEYQQAIFRIRPFDDAADEKMAFFMSSVPLDLIGTELVKEADLLDEEPELLVRARDLLREIRGSGQEKNRITQRELAGILQVSGAAISKAKKTYGSSLIWKEIEDLLEGDGN